MGEYSIKLLRLLYSKSPDSTYTYHERESYFDRRNLSKEKRDRIRKLEGLYREYSTIARMWLMGSITEEEAGQAMIETPGTGITLLEWAQEVLERGC